MPGTRSKSAVVVGNYARSLLRFRGQLMQALAADGSRVYGCAPEIDPETAAALRDLGVEPISIPLERSATRPFSDLRTIGSLHGVFRRIRPDLTLTYTAKPIVLGNWVAQKSGVVKRASIIAGLGSFFGDESGSGVRGGLLRSMFGAALSRTTHAIFQNPDDVATLRRLGLFPADRHPIVVSGSGVDISEFVPTTYPDIPVILTAARIIAEKGLREFASAASSIRRTHPTWRFVLAGWFDPVSPSAIKESEVSEWVRSGAVEYIGAVDDIRPALGACSVFVLPSYYGEGIPRTSLEALAMGRAIITTDMPGCRETVVDGVNGRLVRPRDARALEQAILDIASSRLHIQRMGSASRRLAEERFDVNLVNSQILEALDW